MYMLVKVQLLERSPKKHLHTLYDLPESQGNALLNVTQKIGKQLQKR